MGWLVGALLAILFAVALCLLLRGRILTHTDRARGSDSPQQVARHFHAYSTSGTGCWDPSAGGPTHRTSPSRGREGAAG